jgi:hypothetical protein
MNPFTIFLLALLTPALLFCALFVPPYVAIAGACYIIYWSDAKIHPLADKLDNVPYMLDVYGNLFTRWLKHPEDASVLEYSLPLVGLPLIGGILGFWLTAKLSQKLKDTFQLTSSH